jgi:N-acetylglucosaminyldiphosphoundecaprenol N-acetyl-beta-D-mannosaminyltransferase
MTRDRVVIDDVAFDALREHEVVAHISEALSRGEGGTVITPNVDILRLLQRQELRRLAEDADLVVADGMPIVWASRIRGSDLPERVTGSSLIWSLSRAAADAGKSIYLLGGAEGVAERAARNMQAEIPGLRVAGWGCPPFGFERSEAKVAEICAEVADAAPDIVFVGLGFPKQERLGYRLRSLMAPAWVVGCGGALAMVAGEVSRAPDWVQRSGFEWVHRLIKEPRRMARRYLIDDLPYAGGLLTRSVAMRLARREGGR